MAFNEAQKRAIRHTDGPALVLAGPGSGKTTVITNRVRYLTEKVGVEPGNILVITFTRAAAREMKERYERITGTGCSRVSFGTFHSVFFMILKLAYRYQASNIVKEEQRIQFIREQLDQTDLEIEDEGEFISSVLSEISLIKGELMSLDNYYAKSCSQTVFKELYDGYEHRLRKQGLLDFDDMLKECEELLQKDDALRIYWQNLFSYILIDEFQDINYRQYCIVRLLAQKHKNVFAVGDDDQAIYGFRGAKPACMKQFVQEFGAKQIILSTNYRSHQDIVEASLAVIAENSDRFPKNLEPCEANRRHLGKMDKKNYHVRIQEFSGAKEQLQFLMRQLKDRTEGETYGILFRTNLAMQSVAASLTREGIPFSIKEHGKNIYDHFIVQDILAYLRIAQGTAARADYLRVVNKPFRNISREAFGGEVSLQALEHYYADLMRQTGAGYLRSAYDAVRLLRRQMEFVKNTDLKLAVWFLRKACGYENYLQQRQRMEQTEEWMEILDFITEEAGQYKTLREWQEAQEAYREQLQKENEHHPKKGREENADCQIRLLTVHASKGLEFDHVWIPDCNEKTFPHGNVQDTEHLEEERRIFYVAMTRAKKNLELLCLTGTAERPRFPSRFLIPLNRYRR